MTHIKKITDNQGNDIYLRTHTKAVIDDNGYTAESRLQAMQDEINAKQLELGAVQSDLYPIKNSSNYVTSGGLYNSLYVDSSYTPSSDEYYRYGLVAGSSIGNVSNYTSNTKRVTINIPQNTSFINFTKIESGYHVSLQEWTTDNPNVSIPNFSGTFTGDSGWIESSSVPATITRKVQSSNYLVVCIAKTGNTTITIQEALNNVSFICELVYNKCDNLANELSKLQTDTYGTDTSVFLSNDNTSESNWTTYGYSSTSRGRYIIDLSSYKYNEYTISFSVPSDSPIKVGCSLAETKTATGSQQYIYDTGWVLPGSEFSFDNSMDKDGSALYIFLNTTYVDNDTAATTFEEFLQYCTFQVEIVNKVDGLSTRINNLVNRKHICAGTNVEFVAHRGFHLNNIPENSLDAYMWAGLTGFDMAETDFCPTSDNELVLMHDASINRTMKNADYTNISGTVNVNSKTLAELRENYVLASDDVRYRKPIPTLEEYYITCRESGLFALPEIKSSGTTQTHVLAAYNMGMEIMGEGNFGFCSFSYPLLDYARSLSDTIPLWYIGNSIIGTNNTITGVSRESKHTVWYPSYNGYSFSASLVKQYKAKGMKVAVWTVPVTQCDNVIKAGVDYIAADVIGSNIVKNNGNSYNELDFNTNGVRGDGIQLTSGQHASLVGDIFNIGVYYISILASGSYTISAPNLSLSINDENYTRRIFQGIIDNKSSSITITATDTTNIQSINVKIVRID